MLVLTTGYTGGTEGAGGSPLFKQRATGSGVVLTADGHEVHEAADGEQGLELAERVRPDLVLVDIGLPKIDGYEVARRLRARQLSIGKRWRLVALTGYGQPEDVRMAHEAGFDAHLVKPVFPAALQEALSVIPA